MPRCTEETVRLGTAQWGWQPPTSGVAFTLFYSLRKPMVWDFAEVNPFSEASGNWNGALDWIARVLERLVPITQGQVLQQDATTLQHDGPIISL